MRNENLILNNDTDAKIQSMMPKLHTEVSRFTYPLFAINKRGQPELYASCVLLECDGIYTLVTAAHAINEIQKVSTVHFGAKEIFELPQKFVLSLKLDIAVMVLASDLLKVYELEFLPMTRTTLDRQFSTPHIRCIHGYPISKNKRIKPDNKKIKKFTTYSFTYAGEPRQISPDWSSRYKKDQNIHIAQQYDRLGNNADGNTDNSLHPKGISGGGLWLTPRLIRTDKHVLRRNRHRILRERLSILRDTD